MKKREQFKGIIRFWAAAILVLLQTGFFAYVWFECYGDLDILFAGRGNVVLIGLHMLMIYFFMKVFGGLKLGQDRVRKMLYSQGLSIFCVNVITYLQLCLIARWSYFLNVAPMLYLMAADFLLAAVWILVTNWIYVKLYPPKRMIVVYGGYRPERLIRRLNEKKEKYTVCEVISCESGWEAAINKVDRYDAVLISNLSSDKRDEMMKHCFDKSVYCYIMPGISDIMMMGVEKVQISDTTMLMLRNQGLSAGQRCIKRIFDIVLGLIALIIASPIMLVIAIAIKAYDGGPVFFTQTRLTRDEKIFKIYKFRSMRVQDETEKRSITKKNDDRITPVGHVIRDLHLDELPQIINIIKGDMSIVGPRPEWTATTEEYAQNLPEFLFRLKVKAGLTGYAQVYGKYNTTPYDKLMLDLTYIEKYSFWLDIKILLMTIKVLFEKENTEGVESWQTSAEINEEP
ncbi:MAG: sugar transferase [Oscillospiraceae bacterium]|nr:sugar transferase [Oscillospiraceae bacterium]